MRQTAEVNWRTLLIQILEAHGLRLRAFRPAGGTGGRTWRVETDGGTKFVRRRGVRTSEPARVAFDHGLRRHLQDLGLPVYAPLPTPDGRTALVIEHEVYEIYDFIEGMQYTRSLEIPARRTAAETLACFHRAAASYAAPCEPLCPQFTNLDPPVRERARVDDPHAMLEAIEHLLLLPMERRYRAQIERARARIRWLAEQYPPVLHDQVGGHVIHGDFNCFNLLFDRDGRVRALLDFDWAWRDARTRDIAEGMFFFGAHRVRELRSNDIWSLTQCPILKVEPMRAFLDAYESILPLSATEKRVLPLAMLGLWACYRIEGQAKVPDYERILFFLSEFEKPFAWLDQIGLDAFA